MPPKHHRGTNYRDEDFIGYSRDIGKVFTSVLPSSRKHKVVREHGKDKSVSNPGMLSKLGHGRE